MEVDGGGEGGEGEEVGGRDGDVGVEGQGAESIRRTLNVNF